MFFIKTGFVLCLYNKSNNTFFKKIVHKKIPAFRRGSFALFCFPRLVHIL